MSLLGPVQLFDVEVALYAADPVLGTRLTSAETPSQLPLGECVGNLTLTTSRPEERVPAFNDSVGRAHTTDIDFTLSLQVLDGTHWIDNQRVSAHLSARGRYVLVARTLDEETGEWSKQVFRYVSAPSDTVNSPSDGALSHERTFHARWRDPILLGNVSTTALPSMEPDEVGYVLYRSEGVTLLSHTYNFSTKTYTPTPENAGEAFVKITDGQVEVYDGSALQPAMTFAGDPGAREVQVPRNFYVGRSDLPSPNIRVQFVANGTVQASLGVDGEFASPNLQEVGETTVVLASEPTDQTVSTDESVSLDMSVYFNEADRDTLPVIGPPPFELGEGVLELRSSGATVEGSAIEVVV